MSIQITKLIRKHLLKRFSFLKEGDIPDRLIAKHSAKYHVNDRNITKPLLKYIIDDLTEEIQNQHRLSIASPKKIPEKRKREYFVSIDSQDRNLNLWPNPNNYSIDFGGVHNNVTQLTTDGYVNRIFKNIESIELISVIVPKYGNGNVHINNYPYLLLEVDELPGIYEGSNENVSNAFAKLRFQTDLGYYKECTFNQAERFIKKFNPTRTLNKITVSFKEPSGNLYDFGTAVETTIPETTVAAEDFATKVIKVDNTIIFKIVCSE